MEPTITNTSGAAQAAQNANTAQAAGQTGTQNASASTSAAQQTAMAQAFSALLSNFMNVASENANNG